MEYIDSFEMNLIDELMTPSPSLGDMQNSSVDEIIGDVGVVGLETLFRDSRLPARSLAAMTCDWRFSFKLGGSAADPGGDPPDPEGQ